MNKSTFDGRLYTQAEYDAKHGTYANKSTDTSGLGEYSDAQLLKELVDRSVLEVVVGDKVPVTYFQGLLKDKHHQRIKEIIGE